MAKRKEPKLKGCPWCRRQPCLDIWSGRQYAYFCERDQHAVGIGYYRTEALARRAWNRRANG